MSEQMKKYGAILSGIMLVCVILLMDVFSFPSVVRHTVSGAIEVQNPKKTEQLNEEKKGENQKNKESIEKFKLSAYEINIPKGVGREDITCKSDIMEQTCNFSIPLQEGWNGEEIQLKGKEIKKFQYDEKNKKATLKVQLKGIYDTFYYVENEKLYISFFKPADVYENIVVVDAGHGGVGVGTTQGEIYEKDINLQVTKRLKELFEKQSEVKVYYTRLTDAGYSVYERVDFANSLKADLFVSIHSNSYEGTEDVNGTEVLYSKNKTDATYHSKWFAKIMLKEVSKVSDTKKRNLVDGDYVHIVRSAKMPVALVEMGYMTNETDLKILQSESGQQKIAQGIYNGIMSAMEEKNEKK